MQTQTAFYLIYRITTYSRWRRQLTTPHHQLADYFSAKAIDLGVDLSKLKEKEVDTVFNAFTTLPEEQQATVEAEFQDIHAMACEGGITALIDEANFYDDETFVEDISKIEGFHAR